MDETGDPAGLSEDAAVVMDAGEREVIRASGADRVSFLHRLLTGNVAGTPEGLGRRSLLLDLKGHVVAELLVFVGRDEVRLVVPPGQAAPTAAALSKYAVMDDFAATLAPELVPLVVHGPKTFARLAEAGVRLPEGFAARPPWSHDQAVGPAGGAVWVVRARGLGRDDGAWLFAEAAERDRVVAGLAAAGVRRLSEEVTRALRIESGEPLFGAEITHEHFPMEVGLDRAIDYGKGCYLGQEPIVRIRDRGHINWRLVGLRLAEDEVVPAPGDRLESDVKPRAGRVTSGGRLPGRAPVALALLHVSVPEGSTVRIKRGEEVVARAEVVAVPGATP
jgi:folate-binding protein YgfZ